MKRKRRGSDSPVCREVCSLIEKEPGFSLIRKVALIEMVKMVYDEQLSTIPGNGKNPR